MARKRKKYFANTKENAKSKRYKDGKLFPKPIKLSKLYRKLKSRLT